MTKNRGKARLTGTILLDVEVHALIARGCVMRWSGALSTTILTINMRDITDCFRSVLATPTPCGDHQHWPTWTTRGGLQGHRRAIGMPDHHAPLAHRRLCEQVVGGYGH